MASVHQKGFTLVEMAIVLVIIGLLLGGVLKGQELINGAKIKNVHSDAQSILSAVLTYQQRYKALPGDDSSSAIADISTNKGDANGQIDDDEEAAFYEQLRRANLLTGAPDDAIPTHAFGGNIEVNENAYTNAQGNNICFMDMPGDAANIVDSQYDDGIPSSGAIQGDDAATSYTIDGTVTYDLCYRL
ncbi:type II secretion system protein [Hydrogenovibrio crunogenus]|uniref:Type II secretion system protein n=1 Tax=Hydrogenovibrio crunogenus TaxID=39765 RepID=A0A4P7NZS4_9GAMM|nr:prepilin-type N-terminal cleavage/methylation domain-containing protein [Hydrogenovibrio crunogenus]QBZ82472.1 type II secretion system protein [Hydrogenovibrio crunogenus]